MTKKLPTLADFAELTRHSLPEIAERLMRPTPLQQMLERSEAARLAKLTPEQRQIECLTRQNEALKQRIEDAISVLNGDASIEG